MFLTEGPDFLFSKIVHTVSGNHTASYSMGTGVHSRGIKRPRRQVTAQLNVVLRLKMSAATFLHHLYTRVVPKVMSNNFL